MTAASDEPCKSCGEEAELEFEVILRDTDHRVTGNEILYFCTLCAQDVIEDLTGDEDAFLLE